MGDCCGMKAGGWKRSLRWCHGGWWRLAEWQRQPLETEAEAKAEVVKTRANNCKPPGPTLLQRRPPFLLSSFAAELRYSTRADLQLVNGSPA